jgi:hypothetical protein
LGLFRVGFHSVPVKCTRSNLHAQAAKVN